MIVRDVDVLAEAARRANVTVTFSIPTLDEEVWRKTEPSTAHPRQRLRALDELVDAGIDGRASAWRRSCPASPTGPSSSPRSCAPLARRARRGVWANLLYLKPRNARALPREPRRATGPRSCRGTSGSTRGRAYLRERRDEADPRRRSPSSRASTASATAGASGSSRPSRAGTARAHGVGLRPGTYDPPALSDQPPERTERDHVPDRRRPRGRPRRTAPLAFARAAHPRRRRGGRRQRRGRARRAPQAQRRDHGRPHARDGRARRDEDPDARRSPTRAVLIFTAYSERSLLARGLESGAKGYILKEAPHETLFARSRRSSRGDGFVDPALMPAFLSGTDRDEMLTAREREILQLLADGMSNADVAAAAVHQPGDREEPRAPHPHEARGRHAHARRRDCASRRDHRLEPHCSCGGRCGGASSRSSASP